MSYRFTISDLAFLRSAAGASALDVAAGMVLDASSMMADLAVLRRRFEPHQAAVVEVTRARRRAVGKLRDPQDLLLGDEALQQSTASTVAAIRAAEVARRFPGAVVHDVTCSIGAEIRELASEPGIGGVLGSDLDPIRLLMAQHNCAHTPGALRRVGLLRADALTPTSRADVVIADPARRSGAGRVFRLDALMPPLPDLLAAYTGRNLVVKCAPGLDYRLLRTDFGFDGEVQVVSLDRSVREACLWVGGGAAERRRATVVRTGTDGSVRIEEVTDDDSDDVGAGDPGHYIVDPDGAIVRAGLVRNYAARYGLWQLDPQIAYLTGDTVPPGERGFPVIDRVPLGEKALRAALAERDCGTLEVLVRGVDVDPDTLRKRMKLKGSRSLALVITRIGRRGAGFLCGAGVRG